MGIQIESGNDDNTYFVNCKCVYRNTDGNWTCNEELSSNEQQAFREYQTSCERTISES